MAHQQFRDKMASEGLSEAFINAFLQCYTDLVEGKTGMMPENSIEPVDNLPNFTDLPESNETALLGETVVLKLNGGLGTGMGLEKAKSLLPVKGDDTFLDFIAKQVLHMRKEYQMPLKFVLLNSFSTSDDTRSFLTKYPELSNDPEVELIQNKSPKVHAKTLEPAQWPKNPSLEWCPPGHGDLYAALVGSGKLASLLSQGVKYMFVSNSDNLGATLDLRLLSYFAKSGAPMTMEVCERTESDKKGGHLCRDKTGKLTLRESAQCAKEDESAFQDITKHRYFNTNNLWLNLPKLQEAIQAAGGYLPLPLIRNAKTVDPRDPNSDPVFQLETAMGAAIGSLEGAQAIVVPRTRFAPVKTCNDLFVLRSDCYTITEDYRLIPSPGANIPVVDLDSKLYKLVDNLDPLVPKGVPSLKNCKRLKVSGPVTFDENVVLEGEVEIISKGSPGVVSGHINNQTVTL